MKSSSAAQFIKDSTWLERVAFMCLVLIGLYSLVGLIELSKGPDQGRSAFDFGVMFERRGQVQIRRAGSFVWRDVKPGERLQEGDAIRTTADSTAQIETVDNEKLTINPNSLVVFQRGDQGRSYEVQMGSLTPVNKTTVRSVVQKPKAPSQKLRWLSPIQSQIWAEEGEKSVDLAWSSVHPETFNLEVSRDGKTEVAVPVTGNSYSLKVSPGLYKMSLQSTKQPSIRIEKTVTILSLAAPRWREPRTDVSGVRLSWISPSSDPEATGEIKVLSGAQALIRAATGPEEWTIEGEDLARLKNQTDSVYAFVRVNFQGHTTPWSDPLPLDSNPSLKSLAGRPDLDRVTVTYLGNGEVICPRSVRWAGDEDLDIKITLHAVRQADPWANQASEVKAGFCPPKAGAFLVHATGYAKDAPEKPMGRSGPYPLMAELSRPEVKARAWRESDENTFQLQLKNPAPYPLELEWLNVDGKLVRKQTVSAVDWMDVPPTATQSRIRYVDYNQQSLSIWSALIPAPTPVTDLTNRSPARAELRPELLVQVREEGPLLMSGWHPRSWAEIGWEPTNRAAWYEVQTSFSPEFKTPEQTKIIRSNTMIVGVSDNRAVYWRVRAHGPSTEAPGPWTDPRALRAFAINSPDPSAANRSSPTLRRPPADDRPYAPALAPKR